MASSPRCDLHVYHQQGLRRQQGTYTALSAGLRLATAEIQAWAGTVAMNMQSKTCPHLVHDLSQEFQLLRPQLWQAQQLPEQLHAPILMDGVRGRLAYQVGRSWIHLQHHASFKCIVSAQKCPASNLQSQNAAGMP